MRLLNQMIIWFYCDTHLVYILLNNDIHLKRNCFHIQIWDPFGKKITINYKKSILLSIDYILTDLIWNSSVLSIFKFSMKIIFSMKFNKMQKKKLPYCLDIYIYILWGKSHSRQLNSKLMESHSVFKNHFRYLLDLNI